jgi:SAM-dependent methyltransferase
MHMGEQAAQVKLKPCTADVNGRLWGARAKDWANVQEGTIRPVYDAVLERARVTSGTRYLDVGCGAGMAAQIASERGAQVSGIDAAEALLDIARRRTPRGDFRRCDLEELPSTTTASAWSPASIHSSTPAILPWRRRRRYASPGPAVRSSS